MPDQTTLYRTRQKIDSSRQDTWLADLARLNVILSSLKTTHPTLTHPYQLETEQRLEFYGDPAFANGGQGRIADIPDGLELYRLSSVQSLAANVSELKLGDITKDSPPDDLWTAFNDGSAATGDWRPLIDYAGGVLTGYRGFTWWTSLPLSPDNIICMAHRLGLYGLDVSPQSVLLHYPGSDLRAHGLARVPTVLDAFDKEVFHSLRDSEPPTAGVTISLESSSKLVPGAPEFVLGAINIVPQIKMLPIRIEGTERAAHKVERGTDVWTLLEKYYDTL